MCDKKHTAGHTERTLSDMRSTPAVVLLIALTVASLTGCGEKPQAPGLRGGPAYNNEDGESRLRERTLNQSESNRISY